MSHASFIQDEDMNVKLVTAIVDTNMYSYKQLPLNAVLHYNAVYHAEDTHIYCPT